MFVTHVLLPLQDYSCHGNNQRLATELPRALDSLQNISAETKISSNITKVLDLLSETISARVEKDQLQNTTIHALAVAGDVDNIVKEYNEAFNQSLISMKMNMSYAGMNMSTNPDNKTSNEIPTDISAYNRAVALIDVAINRFNAELIGRSENVSAEEYAISGLEHLRKAMQNKALPNALLGIVHSEIHPNLQLAYGLELAKTKSGQSNTTHSTELHMNTRAR